MRVRIVDVTKIFDDPTPAPGGTKTVSGPMPAVQNVSLDVAEGEFVTLLGPSGCGKTTTLRMVAGFEAPSAGQIYIGDELVNDLPPNKRDTTMVFQSYAIFPHMSVEQNIGFGLELKSRPKKEIRAETNRIMEVMDLGALAKRRPDQLSGGQQQRVALARAIVNKPGVLLFDEPLSNLDAKLRELMRFEIRRIQKTFGITSIYVTHDQAEAMTVSDRIAVMNAGKLVQVGTAFEIYSRPSTRFVADFIGRVNFFEGTMSFDASGALMFTCPAFFLAPGSVTPGLGAGKAAVLAVRPESLELVSLSKSTSDRGFQARGKVTKTVYLGATVEYEIDAGGPKPVLAVSHDPIRTGMFRQGDEVGIMIPPVAAHAISLDA
jgi:iron(III) transport system ATP-binding protein